MKDYQLIEVARPKILGNAGSQQGLVVEWEGDSVKK